MILKIDGNDTTLEFLKLLINLRDGHVSIGPNIIRLRYKLELPSGESIVSASTRISRC